MGVDALQGEPQGLQQLLHLGLFLGDQADIGHHDQCAFRGLLDEVVQHKQF